MNPDTHFVVFGYFEEIQDADTYQMIGTRNFLNQKPAQGYGADHTVERLFKKGVTIILDKAHKGKVPFTFKKDMRCWITVQALCGRMK